MLLESIVTEFSANKLAELCGRIETCLDKLTPEQVWTRNSDNENAAGNLVLHLTGNVRQWILHGVGDQPDIRKRDSEFDTRDGIDPQELKRRLRETVDQASALIRAFPPERLCERKIIQKRDTILAEAIIHVVEHFSYHTGQIIFITKLATGKDLGFYAHLNEKPTAVP